MAASLDSLTKRLGAPPAGLLARLFDRWPDIVGPSEAEHCQPVAVAGGTLVVSVAEPARASQLRYGSARLLERVGAVVGPGVAERVEVRIRPLGHRRR